MPVLNKTQKVFNTLTNQKPKKYAPLNRTKDEYFEEYNPNSSLVKRWKDLMIEN
jgi:hypothetical protein